MSLYDRYREDVIRLTRELIRFDTTECPATRDYPFGEGCALCLKHFLDTAEALGFETKNYDNYIGEVVFGEGEDFAILAHLDVVPAGDGWRYDPFAAEMNDDVSDGGTEGMKIWGRGAIDDKTPAAIILYVFKALRDMGYMPKRRFKLILGCNEETGWRCIDHYNECATMPREGFTPDADFPVIYAEAGIYHVRLFFDIKDIDIKELTAGTAINMVPMNASCTLATGEVLSAVGRSYHASRPEHGQNALGTLLLSLSERSEDIRAVYDTLFRTKFGLSGLSDSTGHLTFSPDIAEYKEGRLMVAVDIRYPATYRLEAVTDRLDRSGVHYETISHKEPLYNDPTGPLITTLREVYENCTGECGEPVSIGGGTYARALECGCGFGPELPGYEFPAHAPNEFITLEHIERLFNIYHSATREISERLG